MGKQSKNKLENILKCKCPRCYSGYMFEEHNHYNLKKLFALNEKCEACDLTFAPEPRYYDGAMFVSYALSVAIVITMFVAFNVLFEAPNLIVMISSTIGLAALLSPLTFRISRGIWIHIFFKFDPKAAKKS